MCVVCLLLAKNKLTTKEAKRALFESITLPDLDDEDVEHINEVYAKIAKEEIEDNV